MLLSSSSAYRVKIATRPCKDHYVYKTVIRAVIESSLVAWMGLLAYAISNTYSLANKENPNMPYSVVSNSFGTSQGCVMLKLGTGWTYSCIRLHRPAVRVCELSRRLASAVRESHPSAALSLGHLAELDHRPYWALTPASSHRRRAAHGTRLGSRP
jgi:hypothetical protein